MLITQADIEHYWKIGASVPAEDVRRYIRNAHDGLKSILSAPTIAALYLVSALPAEYAEATAYITGNKVVYQEQIYTAADDSTGILPTVEASWTIDKDSTLRYFLVKPWLIHTAYLKMFDWLSVKPGAQGFVQVNEAVVGQISDETRRRLRDDIIGELTRARALLDGFYSRYYTNTGTCSTSETRGGGNAWAV